MPEVRLYQRDELGTLPPQVWPDHEDLAYAVRRFDHGEHRRPVHIEDLAQTVDIPIVAAFNGGHEA